MNNLIALLFLAVPLSVNAKKPTLIKTLNHIKPAFTKLYMEEGISSLYVSSFRFRGGDTVKKYSDLESTLNSTSMNIETLSHEIVWPNEIEKFPRLIDGDDHYVVASGFFPPTKNLSLIHI